MFFNIKLVIDKILKIFRIDRVMKPRMIEDFNQRLSVIDRILQDTCVKQDLDGFNKAVKKLRKLLRKVDRLDNINNTDIQLWLSICQRINNKNLWKFLVSKINFGQLTDEQLTKITMDPKHSSVVEAILSVKKDGILIGSTQGEITEIEFL